MDATWKTFRQLQLGYPIENFIEFSRKPPCIKVSLIQFKIIKLPPIGCILNLAAIPSREDLQVSLRRRSNFEAAVISIVYRDFNANKLRSQYKFQSSVRHIQRAIYIYIGYI